MFPRQTVQGRPTSTAAVTLVHAAVPGRTRFRLAGGRQEQFEAIRRSLLATVGVRDVAVNPLTGSILVRYGAPADPAMLRRRILATLRPPSRGVSGVQKPARSGTRNSIPRSLSAAAAPKPAPPPPDAWHAIDLDAVAAALATSPALGLSAPQAEARLKQHGANVLQRTEARSTAAIFVDQMRSLPIALLGASAAVSLATGGVVDAAIIGGVVLLNASIATATERQAERTILGLSRPDYRPIPVLRGGVAAEIDPSRLVPGDIVPIASGELIPADARLIEAVDLTVNEGALTGESLPVHKDAGPVLAVDTPLADRRNMIWRGTAVTGGRGLAVITATGDATEIGRIQKMLGTVTPPETPIQRQL
ncbi:MAG: cation-transporting P-type ATPase, partial [Rhodospirillaceae bacterium]|nr:cation-transporting P-type ATPase [Rhodospirillaceae bacterium]